MQQIRLLGSDYETLAPAVGKIVNAFKCGNGWMVPVSEALKYDPHSVWRDEAERPIDEQPTLYFGSYEVEVVGKNPFAFWNKLKSGALHNEQLSQ